MQLLNNKRDSCLMFVGQIIAFCFGKCVTCSFFLPDQQVSSCRAETCEHSLSVLSSAGAWKLYPPSQPHLISGKHEAADRQMERINEELHHFSIHINNHLGVTFTRCKTLPLSSPRNRLLVAGLPTMGILSEFIDKSPAIHPFQDLALVIISGK